MADQYFTVDDPWTGPEIVLFEDFVFLDSTDDWFATYYQTLYLDVTKSGGDALALRVYYLDSEYNEISFENFWLDNGILTTCELVFPEEEHLISNIKLRNMGEGSFTFTISDIRSDIVHVSEFWTGFKGLREI